MELGPNQIKWIEALRSGDYDQGQGLLKLIPGQEDRHGALYEGNRTLYCCLGVACDVFGWKEKQNEVLAINYQELGLHDDSGELKETLAVGNRDYDSLTEMNDSGMSFSEIADYIENNPDNVFVESK